MTFILNKPIIKPFLHLFAILFLSGCSTEKPIKTRTTYERLIIEEFDSITNETRKKQVLIQKEEKLPHAIELLSQSDNKIFYTGQGWFSSSGLRIQGLGKMVIEKTVENNVLIVTMKVNLVAIAGKESNDTNGYNYKYENYLNKDKNVTKITFRLIESNKYITNKLMNEKTYVRNEKNEFVVE